MYNCDHYAPKLTALIKDKEGVFGIQAEAVRRQAESGMFFCQRGGSIVSFSDMHTPTHAYSYTAQILAPSSLCAPVCSILPCAQTTALCNYNVCMNNGSVLTQY